MKTYAETGKSVATDQNDLQGVTIGPGIPPDVVLTQANRQRDMDMFSWHSFIAMNWPDDASGNVDSARMIGNTASGDHATVWENWISTADIFGIAASSVPEWGGRYVPKACAINGDYKPGMKILDQASKSDDFFEEAFDAGPLIDQSGSFARYEILINREMFNTIKDNKLYDKSQQKKTAAVNFSCGDNNTGKQGAIMIKAAWKILAETDSPSRYHTDTAMVFTPAKYRSDNKDVCEKKMVGLIGMHIVHKTVKQPQWIWSSFEQVDNLPACDQQNTFFTDPSKLNTPTCPATQEKHYSFYSSSSSDNTANKTPLAKSACNTVPAGNASGGKFHLDKAGVPSQLCRKNSLETSAPPVNAAYTILLRAVNAASVWKHYRLIGTQWNSNIESSCKTNTTYSKVDVLPQYKMKKTAVGITPLPLANSTMEGYEQGNSSCISCHSGAAISGKRSNIPSDFVWFLSREVD